MVVIDIAHQHGLRVPARDQQQQVGRPERISQPDRQGMGLKVVDREERLAARQGEALGERQADQQAPDQPGSGRRRDTVDLALADAIIVRRRRGQRITGDLGDAFDMRAGGDFRHDTAERAMLLPLRAYHVRQGRAAAIAIAAHDRHGGFIAATLDAEHNARRAGTVGAWRGVGRQISRPVAGHASFCTPVMDLPTSLDGGMKGAQVAHRPAVQGEG